MKYVVGLVLLMSFAAQGHDAYISGQLVRNAIRNVYGATAGFPGDCFSCHTNTPQIGVDTFGDHFRTASRLVGSGQLSQAQLQVVVNNMNLRQLDSDGDGENNQMEFTNNTDPGDPNSNSQNPTVTTTTMTPTTQAFPNFGGPSKFSTRDAEGNYLHSGCSMQSVSMTSSTRWDVAAPIGVFLLLPLAFAMALRRRK